MKISIRHRCPDYTSYPASRVKAMFNADSGCTFDLDVELPIDDLDWRLGVIVGPSGSGKTSIGRRILGARSFYNGRGWPVSAPVIDHLYDIAGDFNAATSALSAVGLGNVPSWLRPYRVLSNGERFRADLARILCRAPKRIVIDEFTSELDRQIARFGALAFAKAWRRGSGRCVLLTPHRDILPWVRPDWTYDTGAGKFSGRYLQPRPTIDLDIHQTDWRYWPAFEPHHYLKVPRMVAATNYIGCVEGELVAHVAFGTRPGMREARACRLVIMPEWQGAGVGMRFLNAVCQAWLSGRNRFRKAMPTLFHTSHPGLCAALRRDRKWIQVSANLHGDNKARSAASFEKSRKKGLNVCGTGYGGHFRAVQGFRYLGEDRCR